MIVGLVSSITINIILLILLLVLLILYLGSTPQIVSSSTVSNVCPLPHTVTTGLPQSGIKYVLKTIQGNYVQSCFGCLASPVACFQQGVVASPDWNGDKVEFQSTGGNNYQIQIHSKDASGNRKNLYFVMVQSGPTHLLCLTNNPGQRGTSFELIPYLNSKGENVYQIGILETNSLLGESEPSCLVSQGLSLESGFNITPNASRGMDPRSFFLIL